MSVNLDGFTRPNLPGGEHLEPYFVKRFVKRLEELSGKLLTPFSMHHYFIAINRCCWFFALYAPGF